MGYDSAPQPSGQFPDRQAVVAREVHVQEALASSIRILEAEPIDPSLSPQRQHARERSLRELKVQQLIMGLARKYEIPAKEFANVVVHVAEEYETGLFDVRKRHGLSMSPEDRFHSSRLIDQCGEVKSQAVALENKLLGSQGYELPVSLDVPTLDESWGPLQVDILNRIITSDDLYPWATVALQPSAPMPAPTPQSARTDQQHHAPQPPGGQTSERKVEQEPGYWTRRLTPEHPLPLPFTLQPGSYDSRTVSITYYTWAPSSSPRDLLRSGYAGYRYIGVPAAGQFLRMPGSGDQMVGFERDLQVSYHLPSGLVPGDVPYRETVRVAPLAMSYRCIPVESSPGQSVNIFEKCVLTGVNPNNRPGIFMHAATVDVGSQNYQLAALRLKEGFTVADVQHLQAFTEHLQEEGLIAPGGITTSTTQAKLAEAARQDQEHQVISEKALGYLPEAFASFFEINKIGPADMSRTCVAIGAPEDVAGLIMALSLVMPETLLRPRSNIEGFNWTTYMASQNVSSTILGYIMLLGARAKDKKGRPLAADEARRPAFFQLIGTSWLPEKYYKGGTEAIAKAKQQFIGTIPQVVPIIDMTDETRRALHLQSSLTADAGLLLGKTVATLIRQKKWQELNRLRTEILNPNTIKTIEDATRAVGENGSTLRNWVAS